MERIEITLGKEYWNRGKFNFPMDYSKYLPQSPTTVKIISGKSGEVIAEADFLFANENRQPRVNDNPQLKKWFQNNYKEGDKVRVEIVSSTEYKLY